MSVTTGLLGTRARRLPAVGRAAGRLAARSTVLTVLTRGDGVPPAGQAGAGPEGRGRR